MLDARLPDGSGIEVCRHVRSVDPSINALILTSYDDDEALFAAIMAGASGYVLKEIKGTDLVSAVRHVAGGQLPDRPRADRAGARTGPQRSRDRARAGRPHRAGAQAARLIAEGLTNRQIGERMFLAEKTVKNYVSSILAKLGPRAAYPGRRAGRQAARAPTRHSRGPRHR